MLHSELQKKKNNPERNETRTVLYADLWFKKAWLVNKVDIDLLNIDYNI